jgi:hypothetical protein
VNFRVLPSQLHATTEVVVRFFKEARGLSSFKVEEQVADSIAYRPTLQTTTPEYEAIWVEVNETPFLQSLDTVVLHCVTNCLPVKLYVAFPAGLSHTQYKENIDESRRKGLGALEVSNEKVTVIHEALLLSLTGVRLEDHKLFPARYRSILTTAENTFRNGDPAKACSLIYDEIEALSRKIARKIHKKGWWTHLASGAPALNWEKAPWANVMETIIDRANFSAFPPKLKRPLLMRVAALTDIRNDAGHKPRRTADLIKRNQELRTRFENAVDVLRDFADATRPLHI